MAKLKHSKVKRFLNISREAEIHAIPKAWHDWNPIVWEKYGEKTNIPKLWPPKYFLWSRNLYNSQTTGLANSHITEQVWENTDNSQVLLYLIDLALVGTMPAPSGNVQMPIPWKYSAESHIIPML